MQKFQQGKKCLSYMPALCLNFYCRPTSLFQKQVVNSGIVVATYIQQGVVNRWYLTDDNYFTIAVKGVKMLYRMLCEKYGDSRMQEWLERKFTEGKSKYGLWNYNVMDGKEDILTDVERLLDGFFRHLIAWSRLDDITDKELAIQDGENAGENDEVMQELADHTAGLITNLVMAINRMILYSNREYMQNGLDQNT